MLLGWLTLLRILEFGFSAWWRNFTVVTIQECLGLMAFHWWVHGEHDYCWAWLMSASWVVGVYVYGHTCVSFDVCLLWNCLFLWVWCLHWDDDSWYLPMDWLLEFLEQGLFKEGLGWTLVPQETIPLINPYLNCLLQNDWSGFLLLFHSSFIFDPKFRCFPFVLLSLSSSSQMKTWDIKSLMKWWRDNTAIRVLDSSSKLALELERLFSSHLARLFAPHTLLYRAFLHLMEESSRACLIFSHQDHMRKEWEMKRWSKKGNKLDFLNLNTWVRCWCFVKMQALRFRVVLSRFKGSVECKDSCLWHCNV